MTGKREIKLLRELAKHYEEKAMRDPLKILKYAGSETYKQIDIWSALLAGINKATEQHINFIGLWETQNTIRLGNNYGMDLNDPRVQLTAIAILAEKLRELSDITVQAILEGDYPPQ